MMEYIKRQIIKIHRLNKAKRRWPNCNIQTECINFEKCSFGDHVRLNTTAEFWGGRIGDYSYVGDYTAIVSANIGKFCSIGERCSIGGWQHDYNRLSTNPRLYREILNQGYIDQVIKVNIGNDVWIGDNVVITCGNIGNGAVVGANAVVTKDVPPYAIVAGNTAKVLKYRFSQETIARLLQDKWWDKNPDDLEEYIKDFKKRIGE